MEALALFGQTAPEDFLVLGRESVTHLAVLVCSLTKALTFTQDARRHLLTTQLQWDPHARYSQQSLENKSQIQSWAIGARHFLKITQQVLCN